MNDFEGTGEHADAVADEALGESPEVRAFLGVGYEPLARFHDRLRDEGEVRGLIGPREVSRLWERHILNSAAVVPYLAGARSVADIGSGAGLPGIVIACMRPDLEVHLIEPMERRTAWLSEIADDLGLTNVQVKRGRAEEYHDAFEVDAVTSRAVAALSKLARMSLPLLRRGGEMVVLKGRNVAQEIDPARKVLRTFKASEPEILEGTTVPGVESTTIVRIRRG
ncbi:16S rRNA (guanine(527)-N(7))-methyltransferase RsmG [Isoptericola variabilis]|uniref:Ribosomal RNA small subunit methyltransferase G n=1 Tax=Isoptericola variabilis (strain 225) TaxID=743718 RepID=F6FWQ3_ISOV2|nr:16S rRNA (guanine(527)-N(7))-methyltransferase RsmG [Isoptericola variabilis]AEG45694.1 Ribosomal RNA small subunit methyltransferase G [Isoptericola variabilis 225]TWH33755.1 16S rRNA (guanine527-N7)-methyltransferase [Isoptericola variabilis J7]